jgi:hypothetical protein
LAGIRVQYRGQLLILGLIFGPFSHTQQKENLVVIDGSAGIERTDNFIIGPAGRYIGWDN